MKRVMQWLAATFLLIPLAALPQGSPTLAEAKLGKGIQDRQITEEATAFAVNDKAYLWLRLTGGPSDPVQVTWKSGEHSDTIALKVGAATWRTWSSKTLWRAGDWTVTVADAGGNVLKEIAFTVQ